MRSLAVSKNQEEEKKKEEEKKINLFSLPFFHSAVLRIFSHRKWVFRGAELSWKSPTLNFERGSVLQQRDESRH